MTSRNASRPRRGTSLLEVMVVATVIGILLSMSIPSYRRALEQSRAEVAAANLRAIWSAQRVYWLEHRSYAPGLSDLAELLDPAIVSGTTYYTYGVVTADGNTFSVTATRTGSTQWTGVFTLDHTGTISGVVQAAGEPAIAPGFR